MFSSILLLAFPLAVSVGAFHIDRVQYGSRQITSMPVNFWARYSNAYNTRESKLRVSSSVEDAPVAGTPAVAAAVATATSTKGKRSAAEFSSFAVGQDYEGTIISAKNFGIFVDINKGFNVLLPKSQLGRGNYERLSKLAKANSTEAIRVEIIAMNETARTLSGKLINGKNKERPDISGLVGKEIASKFFNATVISSHEFGIFVELEDLGIEGLVPSSKLPSPLPKNTVVNSFTAGQRVVVQVAEVNVADKKLILSMRNNRAGVEEFTVIPQTKWFQSIVQRVTPFFLFVRPAGFDSVGRIHISQIPRELFSILKKKSPTPTATEKASNKTDIEFVFSEGDIVKCRIKEVDIGTKKLELTMLPYRNVEEEEDDYIVEGRDPEGEEDTPVQEEDDDEQLNAFNPEDTLLWWKGAPYTPSVDESATVVADETEIINESNDVVGGTWRRMFEIDLRRDELDISSKVAEEEAAELAEEIGELVGLDDDMEDSLGFGINVNTRPQFGSFISKSILPAGWAEQMEFFKEFDEREASRMSSLKKGKKGEEAFLTDSIRAAEKEAEIASKRGRGNRESSSQPFNVDEESAPSPEAAAPAAIVDAAMATLTALPPTSNVEEEALD